MKKSVLFNFPVGSFRLLVLYVYFFLWLLAPIPQLLDLSIVLPFSKRATILELKNFVSIHPLLKSLGRAENSHRQGVQVGPTQNSEISSS